MMAFPVTVPILYWIGEYCPRLEVLKVEDALAVSSNRSSLSAWEQEDYSHALIYLVRQCTRLNALHLSQVLLVNEALDPLATALEDAKHLAKVSLHKCRLHDRAQYVLLRKVKNKSLIVSLYGNSFKYNHVKQQGGGSTWKVDLSHVKMSYVWDEADDPYVREHLVLTPRKVSTSTSTRVDAVSLNHKRYTIYIRDNDKDDDFSLVVKRRK